MGLEAMTATVSPGATPRSMRAAATSRPRSRVCAHVRVRQVWPSGTWCLSE